MVLWGLKDSHPSSSSTKCFLRSPMIVFFLHFECLDFFPSFNVVGSNICKVLRQQRITYICMFKTIKSSSFFALVRAFISLPTIGSALVRSQKVSTRWVSSVVILTFQIMIFDTLKVSLSLVRSTVDRANQRWQTLLGTKWMITFFFRQTITTWWKHRQRLSTHQILFARSSSFSSYSYAR